MNISEKPSPISSSDTSSFRVAPKISKAAGSEQILVGDMDGSGQILIPGLVYDLAFQCRAFKQLEAHARDVWKKTPLLKKRAYLKSIFSFYAELTGETHLGPRMFELMLSGIFSRMKEKGLFVSKEDVLGWTEKVWAEDKNLFPIASVTTVTHERLDSLKSWLESYIKNGRIHNRTNDFVVFDDSPKLETRDEYRQLIREMSCSKQVPIRYAGLEEKQVFGKALVRAGIPEAVINFALFDPDSLGYTVGANMNAILLDTAGDHIFHADDDTLCKLGKSPSYKEGIKAGTGEHPFQSWFFKDREEALKSISFEEEDLLKIHESQLGKRLGTCLHDWIQKNSFDMEFTDTSFGWLLKRGEGRVQVTLSGLVGDSGSNSPTPTLFSRGDQKKRLFKSEETYRLPFRNREVCKAAEQISIERAAGFMTTFFGLDNRDIMPPFFPNFRNQDNCFGELIGRLSPEALFAYEPWVLVHNPPEQRAHPPEALSIDKEEFWPEYLVRLGMRTFNPGPGARTMLERMPLAGRHLMNIGAMRFTDYRQFLIEQDIFAKADGLATFEKLLTSHPEHPKYWKEDVKTLIEKGKKSVTEKIVLAPHPFLQRFGLEGGEKMIQTLLTRYGELLTYWPAFYQTAKDLRKKGIRLAQPL